MRLQRATELRSSVHSVFNGSFFTFEQNGWKERPLWEKIKENVKIEMNQNFDGEFKCFIFLTYLMPCMLIQSLQLFITNAHPRPLPQLSGDAIE